MKQPDARMTKMAASLASWMQKWKKNRDFLGREYDDLSNSDADTKKELCRIGEIDVRLEEMAGILDKMQEYSTVTHLMPSC